MELTKEQYIERNKIVFGPKKGLSLKYEGGIQHFCISTKRFKKLVNNKLILDFDYSHNCSPSTKDYYDFCIKHEDKFYVHGFVVSLDREDWNGTDRFVIEGLVSSRIDVTDTDIKDFEEFTSNKPGELGDYHKERGYLYSWYD